MSAGDPVDVTFIVPCLNEAGNVTGALGTIESVMKGRALSYEIVVVDDGSSDGTSAVVEAHARSNPHLPVVLHTNERNRGLGYNYLAWASRARGRYYMLVNGDNDISECTLATVLDRLGRAEVVIPYLENQEDRPLSRHIISKMFIFIVNLLGGNRLRYYNGPVLHLRENVARYRPNASGFGYQAELLCRVLRHGGSFVEVPFRFAGSDYVLSSAFRPRNFASVAKSFARILIYRLASSSSPRKRPRHVGAAPGGDASASATAGRPQQASPVEWSEVGSS